MHNLTGKDLTEKERLVLNYIHREIERGYYPPTVREICREIGFKSSSTAHGYLKSLQNKGYICRDPAKPRAITLNIDSYKMPLKRCRFAPLIGKITAGQPVLAEENYQGYLPLPADLSAEDDDLFILTVRGDSMREAGIFDGDLAVVRRQNCAENRQIVAALLPEGATVKRFFKEKEAVRLQPENKDYEPIITAEVIILGRVIGIFRKL